MPLLKGPPLNRSNPAKHRLLLSPAALAASLQKHQRYVRRQSGGMRAFLRFAELPGEVLTARILDEIDLEADEAETGFEQPSD